MQNSKNNPKLTIIIPFHNAIKHKDVLLNNIKRNGSDYISFIIIDDCSEDNLLGIVKKETTEKNILFIKNANKYGISKSRNIGISQCKSDFLLFCDVDDNLDLTRIDDLKNALDEKIDLQIFKHQNTDKFNLHQESFNHNQNGILKKNHIIKLIIDYLESPVGNSILIHCWACIYKRKFLIENAISFNESIEKYEDSLFISEVITMSKCIKISNINIYSHWIHDSGLSYNSHKSIGKFSLHIEIYYQYLNKIRIKNAIDLKHSAISYYLSKTLVQIQNRGFNYIFNAINKILLETAVIESLKFYKIQCTKMPLIKNWMFKSKFIITLILMLYRLIKK